MFCYLWSSTTKHLPKHLVILTISQIYWWSLIFHIVITFWGRVGRSISCLTSMRLFSRLLLFWTSLLKFCPNSLLDRRWETFVPFLISWNYSEFIWSPRVLSIPTALRSFQWIIQWHFLLRSWPVINTYSELMLWW